MVLQAQAVVDLLIVPGDDVRHQIDGGHILDGTGAEKGGHVDDADAPQLDIVLDQGRGTADEGGGADLFDLHGVVGDEPVAPLDQLHGSLALADAAFSDEQDTLAVDLHQHAVTGDAGGKLPGQIGDDGRDDGAGGAGPEEDGDVVLLRHGQDLLAGDQIPGGDEGGDLEAEEPVIDQEPFRRGHLVQIARFHVADDLKPHGLEMVKVSRDLQTRTGHVCDGDLDLFVIRGLKGDFQIELGYHLRKGDRVGFGHFATSGVHSGTIIQRRNGNRNPKKF